MLEAKASSKRYLRSLREQHSNSKSNKSGQVEAPPAAKALQLLPALKERPSPYVLITYYSFAPVLLWACTKRYLIEFLKAASDSGRLCECLRQSRIPTTQC